MSVHVIHHNTHGVCCVCGGGGRGGSKPPPANGVTITFIIIKDIYFHKYHRNSDWVGGGLQATTRKGGGGRGRFAMHGARRAMGGTGLETLRYLSPALPWRAGDDYSQADTIRHARSATPWARWGSASPALPWRAGDDPSHAGDSPCTEYGTRYGSPRRHGI